MLVSNWCVEWHGLLHTIFNKSVNANGNLPGVTQFLSSYWRTTFWCSRWHLHFNLSLIYYLWCIGYVHQMFYWCPCIMVKSKQMKCRWVINIWGNFSITEFDTKCPLAGLFNQKVMLNNVDLVNKTVCYKKPWKWHEISLTKNGHCNNHPLKGYGLLMWNNL